MASIFKSSIGKKLIMSVSGLCLILFLTFHMVMNLTYVFDPDSVVYGTICEILSMGWVNVVVPVLAAFFLVQVSSGPGCSCRTGWAAKKPIPTS